MKYKIKLKLVRRPRVNTLWLLGTELGIGINTFQKAIFLCDTVTVS